MRKITLFVIIIWTAIGVSVAAISLPTLSSDIGKSPAIPHNTVKTTINTNLDNNVGGSSSDNETNINSQDKQKNNKSDQSHSGRLKKQNSFKSLVKQGKNKIKTKGTQKNK